MRSEDDLILVDIVVDEVDSEIRQLRREIAAEVLQEIVESISYRRPTEPYTTAELVLMLLTSIKEPR